MELFFTKLALISSNIKSRPFYGTLNVGILLLNLLILSVTIAFVLDSPNKHYIAIQDKLLFIGLRIIGGLIASIILMFFVYLILFIFKKITKNNKHERFYIVMHFMIYLVFSVLYACYVWIPYFFFKRHL